jgi:hypothetical protein
MAACSMPPRPGGFDVLITVDQHIPDQQNLAGRRISLLILYAA